MTKYQTIGFGQYDKDNNCLYFDPFENYISEEIEFDLTKENSAFIPYEAIEEIMLEIKRFIPKEYRKFIRICPKKISSNDVLCRSVFWAYPGQK